MTDEKTYLYDNAEVKLTGRTATRKLRNDKTDERVEITPVDALDGSWKKWVRRAELYDIE